MSAATPARLAEHHLADLRSSGLSDATIEAAGIYSLGSITASRILGLRDVGAGYAIPYPGLSYNDGSPYVRVRLDRPLPSGAKYLTRKGEGNRLYVPHSLSARWREDTALRLLLTEGEKKALAASQAGFWCLGLPGVWGWRSRQGCDEAAPLSDFVHIAWRGRPVVVIGDSDLRANEQAGDGLRALVDELRRRGARASLLLLPTEGDGCG